LSGSLFFIPPPLVEVMIFPKHRAAFRWWHPSRVF
jgi:hypothetical protein